MKRQVTAGVLVVLVAVFIFGISYAQSTGEKMPKMSAEDKMGSKMLRTKYLSVNNYYLTKSDQSTC